MHQRFSTCSTLENQFNSFFERYALASKCRTEVEIMVPFEFKTNVKLLEDTPFLALYETFQLIRLESPMKDKPARLRVACSSQTHKRMIIQLVQNLADRIQPYTGLRRDLIVCSLLRILQNIN